MSVKVKATHANGLLFCLAALSLIFALQPDAETSHVVTLAIMTIGLGLVVTLWTAEMVMRSLDGDPNIFDAAICGIVYFAAGSTVAGILYFTLHGPMDELRQELFGVTVMGILLTVSSLMATAHLFILRWGEA